MGLCLCKPAGLRHNGGGNLDTWFCHVLGLGVRKPASSRDNGARSGHVALASHVATLVTCVQAPVYSRLVACGGIWQVENLQLIGDVKLWLLRSVRCHVAGGVTMIGEQKP